MQELLYSAYIEKHGLEVNFTRGTLQIPPGAVLALNEKGNVIRYTHARPMPEVWASPVEDPVDIKLRSIGESVAEVTARVNIPQDVGVISKYGKITVTDEALWLKHAGELLNCYEVKGSQEPPNFTPDG